MKKLIIYIHVLALLIACTPKETNEEATNTPENTSRVTLNDAQFKNANIATQAMSQRVISSVIKLNGKIVLPPQDVVSVAAPSGGFLKHSKMQVGMQVRKGDILAVLEDSQFITLQQDYLTAQAQLLVTESEYKRQKVLFDANASSSKTYEQAKVAQQSQLILAKSLAQKLLLLGVNPKQVNADNISKSIAVYAPISGYITATKVNLGTYLNPGEALFEIVNPSNMQLLLTVFEKDLTKLKIGQTMWVSPNNSPEKSYKAIVKLVNQTLSSENTAQVYGQFQGSTAGLLPGMFINANIELTGNAVNALPEDAVVTYENKNYVFAKTGAMQFDMHEVQIGVTENGYTEIKSATNLSGQSFVTKGAYTLLMVLKNAGKEE